MKQPQEQQDEPRRGVIPDFEGAEASAAETIEAQRIVPCISPPLHISAQCCSSEKHEESHATIHSQ
eukprot:3819647-Amphidinium_carterae.2